MLALIASWLTPASLFLFLNLIIGTIAVASRFGSHNKPQHINPPLARAPSLLDRVKSINFYTHKYTTEPESATNWTDQLPQLERAPSLLERFKSINFSTYYGSAAETRFSSEHDSVHNYAGHESESEPAALQRAPSLLERFKSIKLSSLYKSDPEKEPELDAGQGPSDVHAEHQMWRSKSENKETPKKRGKMKKSASEKAVEVDAGVQEREEEVEQRRPATTRVERTVSIGDEGVDAKADDFINRFKQQLKLQRLDSLLRYKEMLQGKPNVR